MKKLTILLFVAIVAITNSTKSNAAFIIKTQQESIITNKSVETSINKITTVQKSKSTNNSIFSKKFGGGGKSQTLAAVLAFFLGAYGVHSFYMGKSQKGLIQLVLGLGGGALYIAGILSYASAVSAAAVGTTPTFPITAIIGMIMLSIAGLWALIDFIRILIGNLEPESGWN